MKEAIQQVIDTETRAKGLVQAARVEAERLVAAARLEGRDCLDTARQEAKTEAARVLAAADAEATLEKSERLTRAANDIQTNLQLAGDTKRLAVEAALRCICGCPAPKGDFP